MYKNFEQALLEIEKIRQELYPNLYSSPDENGSNLDVIPEDDMTDTNNDFTEDTSEAQVSDDEVRGKNEEAEGSGDDNDIDNDNDVSSGLLSKLNCAVFNIRFSITDISDDGRQRSTSNSY